ncbi:MAG: septal ring lytic transglycosylase RlpA family protein [Campylobacteraceae bacterium]|nr:septal ring lytic transglycosylase RlpA family protein [Campylobacteraceae bacterium]
MLCFSVLGCASKSEGYTNKMKNSKNMHRATMRPYVINGRKYYPTTVSVGDQFSGVGSWYGKDFHGEKTSNGETYNMYALTAAHKILPMNTMLKVTNLLNNKSTIVRVNDRGPFVDGRIIDLSYEAAKRIDYASRGTAPVRIEVIGFNGVVNARRTKVRQSVQMDNLLVQFGSFRNKAGAHKYAVNLYRKFGKNYSVLVRSSMHKGAKIHRVYLKGFKSEEEASDFINLRNLQGAFIMRDE